MRRTPYCCKGHIPIYATAVLYILVISEILHYLLVTHPSCFTFMLDSKATDDGLLKKYVLCKCLLKKAQEHIILK